VDAKTILIVDDDLSVAETLAELLMGAGYQTIVAKNGQEAVVELEIKVPDLILADLFMPVSNGFAFCRVVRTNDATRDTPIVVMSGMPNYCYALPVQIDGFLAKPFHMDALLGLVASIIGSPTLNKRVA
jgi:CheY-like chemotaxis protein